MTKYEKLIDYADNEKIYVVETYFESDSKGLCIGDLIAIDKEISEREKACILAEEMGHYYTSVGDILDQSNVMSRKQEKVARRWAVEHMLTPDMLIEAWLFGCSSRYEVADYLNITEDFLMETIDVFKRTYGLFYMGRRHTLFFTDLGYRVK